MQDYPLSVALKEGLAKEASLEAENRYNRPYFRVSETYSCGRRLAWNRRGIKYSNPYNPGSLVKMKMGDVLHNWIRGFYIPTYTQYKVEYWGPGKDQEEELYGTFGLSTSDRIMLRGHIDGVLVDPSGSKALLEIKTMGEWGYKGVIKAAFNDPTHYSMGYALQANRYVHLWNKVHDILPINTFCLFLYNSGGTADSLTGLPHRDYWFECNDEAFNQDVERLVGIEKNIRDSKEEPRGFLVKGWECDNCTFRDACWTAAESTPDNADPDEGQSKPRKAKPRTNKKDVSK